MRVQIPSRESLLPPGYVEPLIEQTRLQQIGAMIGDTLSKLRPPQPNFPTQEWAEHLMETRPDVDPRLAEDTAVSMELAYKIRYFPKLPPGVTLDSARWNRSINTPDIRLSHEDRVRWASIHRRQRQRRLKQE